MESESVWLGPLRGPVRSAAIAFGLLAVLMALWLIAGHFWRDAPISMHDMLRPEGRTEVWLMLGLLTATLLSVSVYLSDNIGHIESRPQGFFDTLSLVTSRLAMIGVIFTVIVMFYEVVARYVFGSPTLWANELSLWIASFVFLFAGQYAMQQRSHIRIYLIYDIMPRWLQRSCDVFSTVLICLFSFAIIWGGFNEAWSKMLRWETFGTAWDPPLPATLKPAILIIIALVAIQAISNLIADWNRMPEHHSPADEIDETEIENIRRTLEDK
ncbi:MAG: TRAP transporter small permease [Pseudomonadota bacterium]